MREENEFSDPDASWGHQSATSTEGKGRSIYGYKLHLVVDTATEIPVAWHMDTAGAAESNFAVALLEMAQERGFPAFVGTMDKGYDARRIYEAFEDRNCRPVIPLRATKAVKLGRHLPHRCRHGEWVFAGTDNRRKAAKWRCPAGKCPVSHRWVPGEPPTYPYSSLDRALAAA